MPNTPNHPNTTSTAPGMADGACPPLYVDELTRRCMGSTSLAVLLLDKFERQLLDDLEELQRRFEARDTVQISRTAHSLKGAAGTVAAPAVRELAAGIEALARQGALEPIATELLALREEVDRCIAYLPAARTALSSPPAASPEEAPPAP